MKKILLLLTTVVVFVACGEGSSSGPEFVSPSDLERVLTEASDFDQSFSWIEKDGYVYLEDSNSGKYGVQYTGGVPKTVAESGIDFTLEDFEIAESLAPIAIDFRKSLGAIEELGSFIEILPGEYKALNGYRSLLFGRIGTYDNMDSEDPEYTFYMNEGEFLVISNTYESESAGIIELKNGNLVDFISTGGFGLKYVASEGHIAGGGVLVMLDFPLISTDGSHEKSIFQAISGDDLKANVSDLRKDYPGKFIFYEAAVFKAIYALNGEIDDNNEYADFSIVTLKAYN